MLGSLILYLTGHEDIDVPTFWLLLYLSLSLTLSFPLFSSLSFSFLLLHVHAGTSIGSHMNMCPNKRDKPVRNP